MSKIENWLLNVFIGKVITRMAVTIIGLIASAPVQAVLAQMGVQVQIDSTTLAGGMIALAHAIFEYFKKRRMANPESPAIQTDAMAPQANVPAKANAQK